KDRSASDGSKFRTIAANQRDFRVADIHRRGFRRRLFSIELYPQTVLARRDSSEHQLISKIPPSGEEDYVLMVSAINVDRGDGGFASALSPGGSGGGSGQIQ